MSHIRGGSNLLQILGKIGSDWEFFGGPRLSNRVSGKVSGNPRGGGGVKIRPGERMSGNSNWEDLDEAVLWRVGEHCCMDIGKR